ncbi:MAG: 3-dehydroquinate synthase, partial [Candidatus Omnitrophica bacterium]|nr:3-dehydroquinate synthase [Candidatus Omnitrophota bacterium]
MKEIRVHLKENSYPIVVGDSILSRLPVYLKKLGLGKDAIVITNPLIRSL